MKTVDIKERLLYSFVQCPDHRTFAALYPSQKQEILEDAVKDLSVPAALVTFFTEPGDRTYCTVRLNDQDEYVTYLVAFNSVGAHFENGHYGFKGKGPSSQRDAIKDMFRRGNY